MNAKQMWREFRAWAEKEYGMNGSDLFILTLGGVVLVGLASGYL